MPDVFGKIAGNHALKTRLAAEIRNASLSHAYIIEGPAGSGKHTIATEIAAALACEKRTDPTAPLPCKTCPACRKILSGNSPDLIRINRGDKATLGVEAVRDLRQDVWIAPNDLDTKIYLIEDAHLMTVQAQNAFLLTLEEPPAYVLFLLLCETAAPLLETVRSRAPILRTEPISPAETEAWLIRNIPDASTLKRTNPGELAEIIAASDGSIGRAKDLLDPAKRKAVLSRRESAREFVSLCAGRRSGGATLRYLASLGQKRDELTAQCNVTLACLRDLLLCKQSENAPLCFFADREEAAELSYSFTTPALLRYCDAVNELNDNLRINANVRLALTRFAVACGLLTL